MEVPARHWNGHIENDKVVKEESVAQTHVTVVLVDAATIPDEVFVQDGVGGGGGGGSNDADGSRLARAMALERDLTPSHQHTKARWASSRLNRQLALEWSRDGKIHRTAEGRPYIIPLGDDDDGKGSTCCHIVRDFNSSHSGRLAAVAFLSKERRRRRTVEKEEKEGLMHVPVLLGLDVEAVPRPSTSSSSPSSSASSYVEFTQVHLRRQSMSSFTARELAEMFNEQQQQLVVGASTRRVDGDVAVVSEAPPGISNNEDDFDSRFWRCFFRHPKTRAEEEENVVRAKRMLRRWHQQWTYKEAILKALGVGIPFGVRRIEIIHHQREDQHRVATAGELLTFIDGIPTQQWLHVECLRPPKMSHPPSSSSSSGEEDEDSFVGSIALFALTSESQFWFAHSLKSNEAIIFPSTRGVARGGGGGGLGNARNVAAAAVGGGRLPECDRRPSLQLRWLNLDEVVDGGWVPRRNISAHVNHDGDDDEEVVTEGKTVGAAEEEEVVAVGEEVQQASSDQADFWESEVLV